MPLSATITDTKLWLTLHPVASPPETMPAEQFSTPEPNLTVSTAGFSIELLGRTGIRYTEGNRSMFIDSEMLALPRTFAIFADSIKAWNPPHQDEALTAEDRGRIIENVRRALEARGSHLQ